MKRILALLLALPVLVLLLGLGRWQWQRAEEKQQMLDAYAQRQQDAPIRVDPAALARFDTALLYRQLELAGQYQPRQYLLDNQIVNRQVGYHVLTPLQLASGAVLLVNRGWIPAGRDRSRLEVPLDFPAGPVHVQGTLNRMPGVGLHLGEPDVAAETWPKRIQYVDLARMAQQQQTTVLPYVVQLAPTAAGGFVRDWKLLAMGPEKHWGYALQWFALALAWTVLVVTTAWRLR